MNEPERVVFRGVSMIEGWPEKIAAAQIIETYRLGERKVGRIRYGSESDDCGADRQPCDDCRVIKGEFHVPGCDLEECPNCGEQLISCDCDFEDPT